MTTTPAHDAPEVELSLEIEQSTLWNQDLAPVPRERRTWRVGSFAALWISMSACIPTYMLASSLIDGGMNWWQAILTIFLGNLIVLVPMILNAHAGTRYGIPFPVFCRASFGTTGANIPALLRAFVACGWFGIQTWIGGSAIYKILTVFFPVAAAGPAIGFSGSRCRAVRLFPLLLGRSTCWSSTRASSRSAGCLNIKAPLLIALGLAVARLGVSQRRRLRADPLAAIGVRSGSTEGGPVLGVLLSGAHRHGRISGRRSR